MRQLTENEKNVNQRFLDYVIEKERLLTKFAKKIHWNSPQKLYNVKDNKNLITTELVLDTIVVYPELNWNYIFTGLGEKIIQTTDELLNKYNYLCEQNIIYHKAFNFQKNELEEIKLELKNIKNK